MLGLLFKIGFGRRIDCKSAVGHIVGLVLFASKLRNPLNISLSIAASLLGFGSFSRSDLVSMASNLGIGWILISKSGVADRQRAQHLNVRLWLH
jgi:hypothetical protein